MDHRGKGHSEVVLKERMNIVGNDALMLVENAKKCKLYQKLLFSLKHRFEKKKKKKQRPPIHQALNPHWSFQTFSDFSIL